MKTGTATLLGLLFGFCGGAAISATRLSADGHWWQALSASQKSAVVVGIEPSFYVGYSEGVLETCRRLQRRGAEACYAAAKAPQGVDLGVADFVARFDHVYKNHPRLIRQPVSTFVPCVYTSKSGCEGFARAVESMH